MDFQMLICHVYDNNEISETEYYKHINLGVPTLTSDYGKVDSDQTRHNIRQFRVPQKIWFMCIFIDKTQMRLSHCPMTGIGISMWSLQLKIDSLWWGDAPWELAPVVYKKHTSILPKPGYPPKVMQYQVDSFEIIYIQAKLNGLSRLYLCMQYKNNNNKKDAMNSRSRKGYIYI